MKALQRLIDLTRKTANILAGAFHSACHAELRVFTPCLPMVAELRREIGAVSERDLRPIWIGRDLLKRWRLEPVVRRNTVSRL